MRFQTRWSRRGLTDGILMVVRQNQTTRHNMSSRAPNLGAAAAVGGSGIQTAEDALRRFLPEREAKL